MQHLLPIVEPSPKDRRELYSICLENVDEAETWLPGWFTLSGDPKSHPKLENIYRDNVAEWVAWAFFSLPLEDVLLDDAINEELKYMIDHFENEFHIHFELGYNQDIISHRINLDPVNATHRPLVFYACIMLLSAIFGFLLQFIWGMKKYGPERKSTLWEPMDSQERPYERLPNENTPEKLSYWFRDGNRSKKPVVFVHGIGVGIMSYITFIPKLLQSTDSPIFFIELPYVSMHCVEEIPTMQETVNDIRNMLHRHEFDSVVFVGHSLGTSIISWATKFLSENVAGVVFIDPICFMLHYKDVCNNFVYRIPETAAQSIVKHFASTELYTSYYISRHFHWFQTALFVKSNVPHHTHSYSHSVKMPENTTVYVSGKDNIIDSKRVDTYLTHNGINSVFMKDLDHASFLFAPKWQKEIISTITNYANQKV